LVFSGAVTYSEAAGMELSEFEECCQAWLQWLESRKKK
jgi:hypothetical protein